MREQLRAAKFSNNSTVNSTKSTTETPVFLDLNAKATQEQPNEYNYSLKEVRSQEIVRIKESENIAEKQVNTDNPDNFTISPLKRKYHESRVRELEEEIRRDPKNTTADMLAKKKELEELKKLLAH